MNTSWDDTITHRQHLAIIQERQRFMETFRTREATEKNDSRLLEELRLICEEKLAPVLVWPEQGEPRVGYLMQRIGNGSHRILLLLTEWKMIRVKASAKLWMLKDDEAFKAAISAQQAHDQAITYITRRVRALPAKKKENGSKAK